MRLRSRWLPALVCAAGLIAGRAAAQEPAPSPAPSPEPTPDPGLAADIPIETPPPPPAPVAAGSKNFLNLSLDGLVAAGASTADDVPFLQTGGHDPQQRGFTIQNVETVLEGAVDPYFRGQANLVFQIDPEGETTVELEEVYAITSSLPHGLQVKAGQFFTEFGRLNTQHPHSWDFVDQPLVNGRLFGGDGLRSVGARVSWLMPTPFYSELFLNVQNSQGETLPSFRSVPGETLFGREIRERTVTGFGDMLLAPRWAASFDLSDTQTLLFGASGAFGSNGLGGRTRVLGVDGYWKWKPTNAFRGFPFVKVQGEWMTRHVSAAEEHQKVLSSAVFDDSGSYLQASYGYKAGHVVGVRVDRVSGDEGDPIQDALGARWRVSPAITWFPTEFSKLRLQYNFDRLSTLDRNEHSVWLQLEFILGAHAAHKF